MELSLSQVQEALGGRYTVEREVGTGGMATVFLAEDEKHHRKVAIKILNPDLASSLGSSRFLREIETVAKLSHPHILPLHDSGEANGLLFYVMPFIKGESLRDRLERKSELSVEEALRIAVEVADALDYAHREGVIHRDVKPANILLESGHAVLADFGIAQAVADETQEDPKLTRPGISLGTPAYMSPEQAIGDSNLDTRTDQYALACVLHEMLVGTPPFFGQDGKKVRAQHIQERPIPVRTVRRGVSEGVEQTILRALEKHRGDRYDSIADFSRALSDAAILDGGTRPTGEETGRVLWDGRVLPALQRPFTRILLTAASLAVLVGIFWPKEDRGVDAVPNWIGNHVVILYFETPSGEEALQRFANLLTDELIAEFTALQSISPITVSSSSAVMESRARVRSGQEIAQSLRAEFLVDGTLVRAGDSLVVRYSLDDPWTGTPLADGGVREDTDGPWDISLAEQMAGELALQLRKGLGNAIRERAILVPTELGRPTEALEAAHAQFSHAKDLVRSPDAGGVLSELDRAVAQFEATAQLDPDWPEPHICLAQVERWRAYFLVFFQSPSDPAAATGAIDEGVRHLDRALEIDPENARALAEKGDLLYMRWTYTLDPDLATSILGEAEESLRTAVALDRTLVRAISTLSQIHLNKGEFEEAKIRGMQARRADAFLENDATVSNNLAIASLNLGEEQEALDHCLELQRADPGPSGLECELEVWAWSEHLPMNLGRARAIADTLLARTDRQASFRARILFDLAGVFERASLLDSALVFLDEGEGCCPEEEALWQHAAAETRVGSPVEAISILGRLVEKEPNGSLGYLERRVFHPLRGHPDFQELRARYTRHSP